MPRPSLDSFLGTKLSLDTFTQTKVSPLNQFHSGGALNPSPTIGQNYQAGKINAGDVIVQGLGRAAGETAQQLESPLVPLWPSGPGVIPNPIGITAALFGAGFSAAKYVIDRTVSPVADAIVKPLASAVGSKLRQAVGPTNADTFASNFSQNVNEIYNNPQVRGDLGAVGNVARLAGDVVATGQAFEAIPSLTKLTGIDARIKANALKEVRSVDTLAGSIVQGNTADITKAKQALSSINVEGVNTYKDLSAVLDSRVKTLSKKLDETLLTNTETKKLPDLSLTSKVGDSTVSHNYVEDAITQLKDHYKATNDVTALQKMNEIEKKALAEGLTIKEINDLARVHGNDLNAFNANGQAASGLSKQAAENTRAGLKSTARELFGNPVFQATDKEITAAIRTRDLVNKMAENVNKLEQKIKTRTWGEKLGRLAGKVVNLIGLNSPKGFVEYFLSRGTGLKTLNALDLEATLQKNLQSLQEVLSGNLPDAQIEQRLQEIIDQTQTRSIQSLNEGNTNAANRVTTYATAKNPTTPSNSAIPSSIAQ